MWERKRRCLSIERALLDGPWEDVGEGACGRCETVRRLYQPLTLPELRVCSDCSQVYAHSTIDNAERGDSEAA